MTRQGGVKVVVVGGRPSKDPMQALGGTKGVQDLPWSGVFELVNNTRTFLPDDLQANFNNTPLAEYSQLPFERGLPFSNGLNFRDGLIQGDETQTPLQFVYEAADCRIWNNMAMMVDITVMWKEVYDVTWGGKGCVNGNLSGNASRRFTARDHHQGNNINHQLSERDMQLLKRSAGAWQDRRNRRTSNMVLF
jgi:hypothetical protein